MAKRVQAHPDLIYSVGAQVVTLKDVVANGGPCIRVAPWGWSSGRRATVSTRIGSASPTASKPP